MMHGIQPRAIEKFQHDIVLAGGRHAEFQRLDDLRMIDRLADFAFARFLEALEAVLECGRLFRIQQFQADDLAALLSRAMWKPTSCRRSLRGATRIAWLTSTFEANIDLREPSKPMAIWFREDEELAGEKRAVARFEPLAVRICSNSTCRNSRWRGRFPVSDRSGGRFGR